MNHWIKEHERKDRSNWYVLIAFTDCESGCFLVDKKPYEEEFNYDAPSELLLDHVLLCDGAGNEIWRNTPRPAIHMTPPCTLTIKFDEEWVCP